MWLYLIVFILGVPFGLGFLIGWLIGRNQRSVVVRPKPSAHAVSETEEKLGTAPQLTALEAAQLGSRYDNIETETTEERQELTPKEQSQRKAERDTKNINTALYVASFLLVAAAALFIGTALPEAVKFAGVWVVVALFYVGGLALHDSVKRLRPAAVAFVGTGLALIPFTGLALYSYIISDASLAWFITSAIGVAAFALAALRLKSQVIAYLTIAFLFSLATSSLSVMQTPIFWYFIAIIALGAVCSLVASWRPKSMPEMFLQPLDVSAQVAVPVAVISSLWAYSLTLLEIALVLTVAALHYAVASLRPFDVRYKQLYMFVARVLISAAILVVTYDISNSWLWVAFVLIALGTVQQMYAIFHVAASDVFENAWVWIGFGAQVAALLLWGNETWLIAMNLILLIGASGIAVYKRHEPWFATIGILAFAALPLVVGWGIWEPPVENWALSLLFLMTAGLIITVATKHQGSWTDHQKMIGAGAYMLYLIEALVLAITESSVWVMLLMILGAGLVMAMSYLHKNALIQLGANVLLAIAAYHAADVLGFAGNWQWLMAGIIAGVAFYGLQWLFMGVKDEPRAELMFYSTVVVVMVPALGHILSVELATTAAVALLIVGGIVMFEGYTKNKPYYYDIALVSATIGLQRLLYLAEPDTNVLVYVHWWALVVGGLALYYHGLQRLQEAQWRGIVALATLSFFVGLYALAEGGFYQLLFLGEHIAMVVLGVLLHNRLVTIWGAIGVSLALLWMLRGYTYLWLALIALGLIGFAVWRLLRREGK